MAQVTGSREQALDALGFRHFTRLWRELVFDHVGQVSTGWALAASARPSEHVGTPAHVLNTPHEPTVNERARQRTAGSLVASVTSRIEDRDRP